MWGLNPKILLINSVLKPFITDITTIKTATPNAMPKNEKIDTILLNPSLNYESNLYGYDNFASIGGISQNSKFVKSLYNIMGINPLPNEDGIYDTTRVFTEAFDRLNELDKIDILNTLSKINYDLIPDDLRSIITPYQGEIDGVDSTILGCMDYGQVTELNPAGIPAHNYNPSATVDDGSCMTLATYGCTDSTQFNYDPTADRMLLTSPCTYDLILLIFMPLLLIALEFLMEEPILIVVEIV